ncbi:5-demethoxyubiquinol-8 5-hydroxylase UbiM [Sphingosinithalassobacter sp. LHW66-3]|uniref:5-demethoxyubiquinol-8 5-hydroxylase UbiM n=1 Tax=Sphingosinithalassobacter sp. LHW66-3 TaxID=3424718 RepID=UPI003D6AD951
MQSDVLIIGGGPAGLAFARALNGSGLSVTLLERQPLAAIAEPADDGREIALTHRSMAILSELGAWERIAEEDKAPLRAARVLNGQSPFALSFDTGGTGADALGRLVSNHRIRAALYACVAQQPGVEIRSDAEVASVRTGREGVEAVLADGTRLRAKLLVGADSRFSWVRDQLGIAAEIQRIGRSMLVARVEHARPHDSVATEWFDHHQTIAMLPLNGDRSSAVVTLPSAQIERLAAIEEGAFAAELERRYRGRLGAMRLEGGRHVYPLAMTWSRHFAATRAALIGDAAVGMHPVTAHGFNLGLSGQQLLADAVRAAARSRRDIGSDTVLRRYERAHRRAAWPLYAGTNALVRLYTDETLPGRAARHMVLRLGQHLPMVRSGVREMLMAR